MVDASMASFDWWKPPTHARKEAKEMKGKERKGKGREAFAVAKHI